MAAEVSFNHIEDVPLGAVIDVEGSPYDLVTDEKYRTSIYGEVRLLGRSYAYFTGSTMIHVDHGSSTDWLIVPNEQQIIMIEPPAPGLEIPVVPAPRLQLLDLSDRWNLPGGNVLITGVRRSPYGLVDPVRQTLMGTIQGLYPAPDRQVLVALATDDGEQQLLVDAAIELSNAKAWVLPGTPPDPTLWDVLERGEQRANPESNGSGGTDWDAVSAEPPLTPETLVTWDDSQDPANNFNAAFIDENRWNGWAKPYFGQEECIRLAAHQIAAGETTQYDYDAARDVWQEINPEEGYRADCRTKEINGSRCHELGSGFTWLEVTPELTSEENETLLGPASARVGAMRGALAGVGERPSGAHLWAEQELDQLPVGAVMHSENVNLAWIKTEMKVWANYENWRSSPIASAELAYISGGELRKGTGYFEDLATGRAVLPSLPLDPEQPPTAVKAEVRTERPEATRVSVLGLKKGSLIVNDAGAVAKVERVLRSGDDVHLRVRNEHGQLGKLTVAPDKHFLQLAAGAELVAAPEQAGPVLELAHNPHDGPSLS
ncbi:hypothetical protein [Arthrobacter sp. U41]|uniref:hypothetical protein n=1 Tax=Arthrobacter sp. U41 TaxID=1849032 RepID=UPI0012F8BAAE|nr:hypothetical protein [Arthrobacter sp. U41]